MAAGLDEADQARLRRSGFEALGDEQGLGLFDVVVRGASPQTLAVALNRAVLHSRAAGDMLPPVFSGLIRGAGARRKASSGHFMAKLATLPASERDAAVLDVVRVEVAAVLGHDTIAGVDPEMAFKDLGFDSLAAVELRNRLVGATGVALQPTAVFDYPNPIAMAGHLLDRADIPGGGSGGAEMQIDQLRSALSAASIPASDRVELAGRLRAVAADLEEDDRKELADAEQDRLETASDDELLAAIDDMAGTT
jgi:acyl carrier protein